MTKGRRTRGRLWWGLLGITLAGLGAFFLLSPSPPPGLGDRTQWLAHGPAPEPFSLPATQNSPFVPARLTQHWTLLLFGYTHCPDVCPTDLGVLAAVMRQRRLNHQPVPHVVFVSVDPQRDTLAILTRYLNAFDTSFIGAQADDSQLKPFTQLLGVYALRHTEEKDAAGNYPVDHGTSFYLFNPKGKLQASFQMPQSVSNLSDQLHRIIPH